MNRLYERSSNRCAADALDAGLRAEIAAHADAHQLGDVLGDARFCCETRSVRAKRPGLLSRITGSGDADTEHRTIAVVTSRYLIVAIVGEKRGTHVRSIRLDAVSVGNSEVPAGLDSGVSATGLWSGGHEAASFYLGLGDDAEGNAFLDALRVAIAETKSV
jgi:hypothetical protein